MLQSTLSTAFQRLLAEAECDCSCFGRKDLVGILGILHQDPSTLITTLH